MICFGYAFILMKIKLESIAKILMPAFILSLSKLYGQKIEISVFPNPSSSSFTVKYTLSDTIDKINLHIYNANSELVYKENLYNCKNKECEHVINSDSLSLSSGYYILKLFCCKKDTSVKLIIIK